MGRGRRFSGPVGGGGVAQGVPFDIDLSAAPDADPDGIVNSSDGAEVTYNKSGTGHSTPARWNQRALADGETVTLLLKAGSIASLTKLAQMVGVHSSGGDSFAIGMNSHNTGVVQLITFNGTAHTYVTTLALQDTIRVIMTRRGGTVYVQSSVLLWKSDGSSETSQSSTTNVSVSGDVQIAVFHALNDAAGGTLGPITYSGTYAVQDQP